MDREELWNRLNSGERNFAGVDWSGSILQDVNMTGINLRGANLSQTDLCECIIDHANLEGINFEGARLEEVRFEGSNLGGANFNRANLFRAAIYSSVLDDATFQCANLTFTSFANSSVKRGNFKDIIIIKGGELYTDITNFQGATIDAEVLRGYNSVRTILPNGDTFTYPGRSEQE